MNPRTSNVDWDTTKARNFADKRSRVLLSGAEMLHGLDWDRRVRELGKRSNGMCEYRIPTGQGGITLRCQRMAQDPHHIIERSKGRDDRLENLQALCRHHHRMIDERKVGGRARANKSL